METSEIFKQAVNDFKNAYVQAQQQTRKYNAPITYNFETPEKSRFKAVVYFKNNRCAWYYSFDLVKNNGVTHVDEYVGLVKLLRLIKNKVGEFNTALIFASIDKIAMPANSKYDYCIAKFSSNGQFIERPDTGFKLDQKNNLLQLSWLELHPKMLIKK